MNAKDNGILIQRIREQYTGRELTGLDRLRALDAKVKRPAEIFAYTFGGIAALVMGSGMSLVMTDIARTLGLGDMTIPGIAIGIAGMLMALLTYPIYKRILDARKKKYAGKVATLCDELLVK